jgi:hypothetical protein
VIFYEKRKNKVLDVGEFIPEEDDNEHTSEAELGDDIPNSKSNREKADSEDVFVSENDIGEASYERDMKKCREEFEKTRSGDNPNMSTRYSKMYNYVVNGLGYDEESNEGRREPDIFDEKECPDGEDPEDYGDDYDYDLELPREKVEPNIEIFTNENPQDFVTLTYYAGDKSLVDDREQLIPNASEVVGNVALERLIFGGSGVYHGTIYVRNTKSHINYEVILDMSKYSETILGIIDSRHRMNGDNRDAGGGTE